MAYYFYNNNEFLGELSIEQYTKAQEIANSIGANYIYNATTKGELKKCPNCGAWEYPHQLINGLCSYCDYLHNIEKWLTFYDQELGKHFDGEVDNYGEKFIITFKGKKLVLEFGPDEDQYFIEGIRQLLKNAKEEIEQYKNKKGG